MGDATRWSYAAGEKGRNRVLAYERSSGIIYLEFFEHGERRRISTGHRDRAKAKQEADEIAARFGEEDPEEEDVSLGTLFDKYVRNRTPEKAESTQEHDRRCKELFCRYFGHDIPASDLNRELWDRFIRERGSGAIDARGHRVPEGDRTERGARIVAKDLKLLNAALRWAVDADLLDRNPCEFPGTESKYPSEDDPARPVVSQKRYEAMLGVADDVDWRFRLALVLANETGHRIGSIRRLRWSDVKLEKAAVRWRGSADKMRNEHVTPLTEAAVRALREARQVRPAVGDAWVFPAPEDSSEPCSRHLMRDWWLQAERRADLDHPDGMGWHAMRRKFATEHKGVPLKDLEGLGGWKESRTLMECYQTTDLDALREAQKLRESGAESG